MERGTSSSGSYNPLSELMRAIILRVIDDYATGGELQQEAAEYLESEEEDYIFSFRAICRHFGFNVDLTRQHIISPKEKIRTRRRAS